MTIVSPQTFYLLSLSKLKGVGPAALKRAILLPGFDRMSVEELAAAVPPIARSLEGGANWHEAQDWAYMQVTAAEKHNARILSAVDGEYPALLAATKDDPFIIYVQGALAAPDQRSLAIIGTREPTSHGAVVARRITTHFGEAGWSIVSGLAIGCDGLAHQSAIDCGAHTVAVMAHGLHMTSPSKHRSLAQTILDRGGALVSEYPFGQAVQRQQYVKRDRTQAGMALGVVMVQSDLKGGSLYASRATLEYGRWLAIPYPTIKDRDNMEPKVQANLVISEAAPHERADLLRCSLNDLERVIILRSKEDYWQLAQSSGVEPFIRGELAAGKIYGTEPDALEVAEDLFQLPSSQSQIFPVIEGAKPEPVAPPWGLNFIEGGVAVGSVAPDFSPVAGLNSSPEDTAVTEIGLEPALRDAASAEDRVQVDALSLERFRVESATASQLVEVGRASALESTEWSHRIRLDLSLPKDDEVLAAFGLWMPPKIGSKGFKKWLGDSADEVDVREFYARHRRLHTHLADLQRKLVSAKRPISKDQVLALHLVGEEVVLHLSRLANLSLMVEEYSKNERLRLQKEDWIEQNEAVDQSLMSKKDDVSVIRSSLVADLSALLSGGITSFFIGDEDADGGGFLNDTVTRQLGLSELVNRLNSVLLSTF
ncbi:DNA-processing protein DprA [Delftia sp. WSY_4]|uniref:DNA-processing protein DprA n=1 Tax=unclassified Delftia TaxID=2613839 RepID=UPI00370A4C77